MLKLKKVQILGFKSFCDKTELHLSGSGMAAIVGPNGCGKSNISDAITWVLGEQSAKSLRGSHMADVIFSGTSGRKPTGMAEVSLTLIDPEVYDGDLLANASDAPDIVIENEMPSESDWDEEALRAASIRHTESAMAAVQPAPKPLPGTQPATEGELSADSEPSADSPASSEDDTPASVADAVVLKIRRRKFQRNTTRAGEIVVTRRLFRTGESEYLLNGKLCRLRDILDIFAGTGLSGENYSLIGQEKIGQLISSKPLERRAIIEEAAGITRFKTKKRLSELRLESAKQNLARINDIFDEVSRQMQSLKRQAAKARRYTELREELRTNLRVVLASRMAQMDAEQAATAAQIHELGLAIDAQSASIEQLDAESHASTERGYQLDGEIRAAADSAHSSEVELERIASRTAANIERIAEIAARAESSAADVAALRAQLESIAAQRTQQQSFLASAAAEADAARAHASAASAAARSASDSLASAESSAESSRRRSIELLNTAAQSRNAIAQAEESLAALQRDSERLQRETAAARTELSQLGVERGQVSLQFETVSQRLARLESEIAALQSQLAEARSAETDVRRRSDSLRAEVATLLGRRNSLDALINEHSYSTEAVRDIFRANKAADQSGSAHIAPVGTLADFLEVDGKYEAVVDEFLRDELNYIVVKNWDAAEEGMRMLSGDVAGRATFLVHPSSAQAKFSFAEGMESSTHMTAARQLSEQIVPLRHCMRVLDGFGRSLEVILPKLRDGFMAPNAGAARNLALENPQAFFLSPSGEFFHNVTVTGGRTRSEGPLALKRELRDVQARLDDVEKELSHSESQAAELVARIASLTAELDDRSAQRRIAERDSATSGAALRAMESEAERIQRRITEWSAAAERNLAARREESARLESEHAAVESALAELNSSLAMLRSTRDTAHAAASQAAASAAGIEERRRASDAAFQQTDAVHSAHLERIAQLDQQHSEASAERCRREQENAHLAAEQTTVAAARAAAIERSQQLTAEAAALRTRLAELDTQLRTLRHQNEAQRETRAALAAHAAKLESDLAHMNETCVADLGVEASVLRDDESLTRISAADEDGVAALAAAEESVRAMRQRLENMGPVNMMALDEYAEAEQRYTFLDTQRTDLIDSIANTQATIKEIDEITRTKFDEAYKVINENFSATFAKLFGGGAASMRLLEMENSDEAGIELIAQPPGKKLQNILLLSGGEKALTAFSLLVAIFQFQPAPFCVLDEVDAPLDEANVGRFARLVEEMSQNTQFVVITHSKRTMAQAEVIYGVTMQEQGVSKIVSVKLGNEEKSPTRRAVA